ncbi:hypothetical protein JXM67_14080 [candidate division WOR-3 bacterium]|nr:hypothetical protein [candidate division WOR-3 bacterium]
MENAQISESCIGADTLKSIRIEIKKTQGWLRFLGILNIVIAPVALLVTYLNVLFNPYAGPLQLVVSAVSGVMSVALAIILLQASSRAGRFTKDDDFHILVKYHRKLSAYFTVAGIVIALVLAGILLLAFAVALGAILGITPEMAF